MISIKYFILTAMGVISGLVLAGVGGLSAKTIQFYTAAENPQKIEKYWQDINLKLADLNQLVSNEKCNTTDKYFQACLNSVVENALNYNLKLSDDGLKLVAINGHDRLDEKNQKELLNLYLNKVISVNFDKIITQIYDAEKTDNKSFLVAQLINSFLSVYFDPHTYILPTHFYDEVGSKLKRSKLFVGITYEKIHGEYFVRKITKNSDADLGGLQKNDKLVSINEQPLKNTKYTFLSSTLRDANNAKFLFKIERNFKTINITVKRTYQELGHVQYTEVYGLSKTAIITLTKFNSGVCTEVATHLKHIKKNNIQNLILDLRDNPGGLLSEAACVAGVFLGKNKKAYYVEYFNEKKPNEVVLTSEAKIYFGNLAVLVNSSSASASEMLAGNLQEHQRALVIGSPTFGKGTFQEPETWELNENVSLFKTQGFYLLPSRNTTQLIGVMPDVLVSENNNAKREFTTYANPINIKKTRYNKLAKTEQATEMLFYKNCKLNNLNININEDLYLSKAMGYFDCAINNKITAKVENEILKTN